MKSTSKSLCLNGHEMAAGHLFCPHCGLERAPRKVVTPPARSAVPDRDPIEALRLVIGTAILLVIIIAVMVAVSRNDQATGAAYKQGYSWGYHATPGYSGEDAYSDCFSAEIAQQNIDPTGGWDSGCIAGFNDARSGKAYSP